MIEHTPWIGPRYMEGIAGQRIAIAGYSHWADGEGDHAELTHEVVKRVMSGCYDIAFFNSIRDYFGFADHPAFWERVRALAA